MSERFFTIDEQFDYLTKNKNIICNEDDKLRLIREGYFNVITGYKYPFILCKNPTGEIVYEEGTSLNHFLCLKDFDDSLRILLLEYLVKVEQEVRTLAAYKFDISNKNGQITWREIEAYDQRNKKDKQITHFISKCFNEIIRNENYDIQVYLKRHEDIPTWAFMSGLTFNTFIQCLDFAKPLVIDTLCGVYGLRDEKNHYNYDFLKAVLNLFRKVRNICAHNEKAYCFKINGTRLDDKLFSIIDNSNYLIQKDQRLMDIFVHLKYFLDNSEYKRFIYNLKDLLLDLKKQISELAFANVLKEMGIYRIEDLDTLVD